MPAPPSARRLLAGTWLALALALPAAAATLERGNGPEPSTLDAHKCQEVACGNVLRDLYEGLVTEDARGRLVPGMAERWSVSPDGRTWTFHLRAGLRWSDGRALDATQIVASFRRAFAPATAAPFAELFDALLHARDVQAGRLPPARLGVEAPDARTVVFRLERGADLPALLTLPIAFPVNLPAVARHGAQHTRPGRLVGNGAYRLVAWTPQANLLVARNPHFHAAGSVAIERVRFHVTEDAWSRACRTVACCWATRRAARERCRARSSSRSGRTACCSWCTTAANWRSSTPRATGAPRPPRRFTPGSPGRACRTW